MKTIIKNQKPSFMVDSDLEIIEKLNEVDENWKWYSFEEAYNKTYNFLKNL